MSRYDYGGYLSKKFVDTCLIINITGNNSENANLLFEKIERAYKCFIICQGYSSLKIDTIRRNLLNAIAEKDRNVLVPNIKTKCLTQYSCIRSLTLSLSEEGNRYLAMYYHGIVKYQFESILFDTAIKSGKPMEFLEGLLSGQSQAPAVEPVSTISSPISSPKDQGIRESGTCLQEERVKAKKTVTELQGIIEDLNKFYMTEVCDSVLDENTKDFLQATLRDYFYIGSDRNLGDRVKDLETNIATVLSSLEFAKDLEKNLISAPETV